MQKKLHNHNNKKKKTNTNVYRANMLFFMLILEPI